MKIKKDKTFVDLTSSFERLNFIPNGIVPISITSDCPKTYSGLHYWKLSPKFWLDEVNDYKICASHFVNEVLSKLDPEDTWKELRNMTNDLPFVLLCNEKEDKYCHRRLVADWFRKNGFKMKEF